MIDEETSIVLILLMLANFPFFFLIMGVHETKYKKKYHYERLDGCSQTFYGVFSSAFCLLAAALVAGGTLDFQGVDFSDSLRIAGWWTFAVGDILVLSAVTLFFVFESHGWAIVTFVLSFGFTIAAAGIVVSYAGSNANEDVGSAMLFFSAFLIVLYTIILFVLSNKLERAEGPESNPLVKKNCPAKSNRRSSKSSKHGDNTNEMV